MAILGGLVVASLVSVLSHGWLPRQFQSNWQDIELAKELHGSGALIMLGAALVLMEYSSYNTI